MPFENRTWKFLVPVVGTLFLAAACGGGGGGTDPDARSERAALTTFLTAASVAGTEDAAEENIVRQAVVAANQAPVGTGTTGGVSQVSDSTVADPLQIVIAIDRGAPSTDTTVDVTDNDRRTFDITFGSDTINTVANAAGTNTDTTTSGAVDNTELTETVDEDEARFVTFVRPQVDGNGDSTGNLHVWVSTDTPNSVGGDEDYLAYGFWVDSVDGTGTTTIDGLDQIGAFVDSNDEIVFPVASIATLSGDAVYIGEASGLYHEEVGGESDFMGFTADARLTASFDATADPTIEGTIDNFEGLPSEFDDLEVTLAGPSAATAGFFTGTTSASVTLPGSTAATDFDGDWGGKFYDDRNLALADDAYPGTFAGTFGIEDASANPDDNTMMDRRALLGVFWGDYDPDPPAVPAP